MTASDQRTEPVYEIHLRELGPDESRMVVLPEAEPRAGAHPELEHPDPTVRLGALSRMVRRPTSIKVAAVGARLQDPDASVRRAAIDALATTGDERALVLLLDAIQDPVEQVRRAAGDALRRHRSPELLVLIRAELRLPTRAEAADRALALLDEAGQGESHPPAMRDGFPPNDVTALIELLGDPRPDRRRIACERLGFRRARDAVEPLLERLSDPERGVRIKAADALALIGDERALRPLERARAADSDPGVAQAMRRAARTLAGR